MKAKVKAKDLTFDFPPTGWIVISAFVDGILETRKYGGYTKRTASKLFRDEFNKRR